MQATETRYEYNNERVTRRRDIMKQQQQTHGRAIRQQNGPIHCIDRQWFYCTSGPRLYGPYASQDDAEAAMARHQGSAD